MFPPASIGDIALTGCLIVFLREIFLAVTSARRAMR